MYESPSWLNELWIARETLWQGFLTSVQVSALAILFGTLLGVVTGLVLTYGRFWMRAPFRFTSTSFAVRRCLCWCWPASIWRQRPAGRSARFRPVR